MNTTNIGVMSIGLKMPIFREGDDVANIISNEIVRIADCGDISIDDNDIIAVTESVVARSMGNYVTVDDIADDIRNKFGDAETIGVLYPIYSRNRFSLILKGIARAAKKVVIQLNNGKDEVGNDIVNQFTDVDIIDFYRNIVHDEGAECEIYQSELKYEILIRTTNVIVSTIHTAHEDKNYLSNWTKKLIYRGFSHSYKDSYHFYCLDEILNEPNTLHGYNEEYGLLGSNKSSEERLKLFPRTADCMSVIETIQTNIQTKLHKHVEVMVYGDGCFKDPLGGIWEFADPIVSPAYTDGLNGSPNEIKLKYLIDNESLSDEDLRKRIQNKGDVKGKMISQGTTPRRYTDLIGSLCDLTSGSGDRGCPVVLVKNYFTNYNN